MNTSTNQPAAWYPQPNGTQRYWNGEAWTDQVAIPTVTTTDRHISTLTTIVVIAAVAVAAFIGRIILKGVLL